MDMDEKEYLESLRKRARRFKLKVLCDRRTGCYFIVDAKPTAPLYPRLLACPLWKHGWTTMSSKPLKNNPPA